MRLRTIGPRLRTHQTTRLAPEPKVAAPFYRSPEWRTLIASVIAERGRRCQDCGRTGCRIFGDHVVELQDGGPALDPRNLRLLCGSCHTRKTTAERGKRVAR